MTRALFTKHVGMARPDCIVQGRIAGMNASFEMVEKGFVTDQDFREFTFTNAARLHTGNNPAFFKGTVVEQAVADELDLRTPSLLANA
jgi:hypothetical protein